MKATVLIAIFVSLITFLMPACKSQRNELDACRKNYLAALTTYNQYYVGQKDSAKLVMAIQNLQHSLICPQTRSKSIDLKISLLVLLKQYKQGYQFVDSLTYDDLSPRYKKTTYANYFRALELSLKGDSMKSKEIVHVIVDSIQNYITNERLPHDSIDVEAYYNLFLFKSQIVGEKQIRQEVDSLKSKYPRQSVYLDAIVESARQSIYHFW